VTEALLLGATHAASFDEDPKHVAFALARYHFVARMLVGRDRVLEFGCGDGTGARIVRQAVGDLYGLDVQERGDTFPGEFMQRDCAVRWIKPPFGGVFDAVYALDVLEHIAPACEDEFLCNVRDSLHRHGAFICGMPSLESQPYASENSRREHVNCKTEHGLRATLANHFHSVFLFGMNDTTLHTGFGPLCHYRLALCAGKR
jgi:SAM-dependent methyltransferase